MKLRMRIEIEGWRAGDEERREAASVPTDRLPGLTDGQRAVARKLGISEERYSRSAYAGRLNQQRLLEKTRRFGSALEERLRARFRGAQINLIRLVTIDHEYCIEISANGKRVPFRVSEDMVDEFIERGSAAAGETIERNLETVLNVQAA